MKKYIFFKILVFILNVINITNEIEMIEKYATVNLNQTKENENKTYLINDYCNIAQSQITIQFFENIFEYFNSSDTQKDQCLFLDDIFKSLISSKN